MEASVYQADCLDWMREQPDDKFDLVFTSPPYEDCRLYGELAFKLKGQDWVDWMLLRIKEMVRICRVLVGVVVAGKTRGFRWSGTPVLLQADLIRAGVCLRNPPVFHRIGIAGSGGPDWLRSDYETIICCTKGGKLPWSDNTAMGHPPRWAPGGEMSHRVSSGARVNQWGHSINSGATVVLPGGSVRSAGQRPSHVIAGTVERDGAEPKVAAFMNKEMPPGSKLHTKRNEGSSRVQCYTPPKKANPGNVIHCKVGGGVMGSRLCHENEAPFPEKLAEFFIKSWCPPGGIILDPFCGSGTTLAVAIQYGRNAIGVDARQSQVDLSNRRIIQMRETLQQIDAPGVA